jgi:hypothetical protein
MIETYVIPPRGIQMNILIHRSIDRSLVGAVMTCIMVSLMVAGLGLSLGVQVIERWLPEHGTLPRRGFALWRWKTG